MDDLPLWPQCPPPLKTAKLIFIVVSPSPREELESRPGDSQRESGRFARIDLQRKKQLFYARAIRTNRLKPAIRSSFFAPQSAIRKAGVHFGHPETIRRDRVMCANLRIDSRESGHPRRAVPWPSNPCFLWGNKQGKPRKKQGRANGPEAKRLDANGLVRISSHFVRIAQMICTKNPTTLTLQPLLLKKKQGSPQKSEGFSVRRTPKIPWKKENTHKKQGKSENKQKAQGNRKKARIGGSGYALQGGLLEQLLRSSGGSEANSKKLPKNALRLVPSAWRRLLRS